MEPSEQPENFIDPASFEGGDGEAEQESTETSERAQRTGSAPSGLEQFEGQFPEVRQVDLRNEETIKLEAEREEFLWLQDERLANRRKQAAEDEKAEHEADKAKQEARKAEYEANRGEARGQYDGKHSLTTLVERWVFFGILLLTALAGIGVLAYGVITKTSEASVAGVAVLSGTSGSVIWGLVKSRAADDKDDPPSSS